jgi:hypothetical protein
MAAPSYHQGGGAMPTIDELEARLRDLDEEIARVRHELIWRKREVRPGYSPVGLAEVEARYEALSLEFTQTWEEWRAANAAEDVAMRSALPESGN